MGNEAAGGGREDAAAALVTAKALHRSGELGQAEAVYRALLEADPNNAEALHYLGIARHQQGQSLLGIDLVRRALELRPGDADALNNLGNIYQQIGAAADAAQAYRCALEARPDHPDALHNLGLALRKLKRHEEAAELHRRAVERQPENLQGYYALANAYKDMGCVEDALAALRRALGVRAEADGFRRLGQLLYGLRRIEEAAATYEAWARAEPDNPIARHMLAACTRKDVPARAEDAFVSTVFDGFAESFDAVLMGRLEYRAPALVGGLLERLEGEPRGALDILDAGCGTGLLGPHLRPYARRLVGVDLSPKMLQKAAHRAVYDELVAAELSWYLGTCPQGFDVVASSDTLVYFGELGDVLGAASAALRPGGRLVFTLEQASDEADVPGGYRIHPHGRYSHTEAYVRDSLSQAGFEVIEVGKERLRREGAAYVAGLLVAARLRRGSSVRPRRASSQENLAFAIALHQRGELQRAEPYYLAVLDAHEDNPEALHYLGVMRAQQGRRLAALNLLRRALDADPGCADVHYHLGSVLHQLGLLADAVAACRRALELRPAHPEASRHLASLLEQLAPLEASAEVHRRALERQPGNADALYALAALYGKMGRADEEMAALKKALASRPDAEGFRRLGSMLCGSGQVEEAAAVYADWLGSDADNPVAAHLLAACTRAAVPERASDGFVARDFDRFAERFDAVLESLEYRAPALVGRVLQRVAGSPRGELDILDAGCGTGLLAPHLRPYARRLVGLDLSPKMLEKAAARGLYDDLVEAELTSYLGDSADAFDVIAASDTLNYFGALQGVLAAAHAALHAGGTIHFTLEDAGGKSSLTTGYAIHPDGRYMHTESYARGALAEAGFVVLEIEKGFLRREGDAYVAGLVLSARKPS